MYDDLRATRGVVVDAGHGGDDPGAVNGNIKEKDFTLAVAEYIYKRLQELGIPTYITRSTDETLDRDERVNRILSAFGNNSDVIVLSNHINAGGDEFTYHYIIWLGIRTSIFELVIFMIKYTKIVILYVIMV